MKATRIVGTILLVLGVIILLLFATADLLGIGENPSFGVWQIAGTIVGAVVAIIGLVMLFKRAPVAVGNPPSSDI